MKRIATIIVGLALLLPSTALAASSSTCQSYSQKVCNVSAVTQTNGPTGASTAATAASNTTTPTSTSTSSSSLPFTGLDVGLLVVGGALLLGTGMFVRRASRRLS